MLFRPKSRKVIYHVGAWAGNFGDSILQESIRSHLVSLSPFPLEIRYLNCQKTEFTHAVIEDLNANGHLLIVGGGGLIFHRPQDHSRSGWQWNIEQDLIGEIKVPLVVYGVGYNQFEYDPSDFLPATNAHLQRTVAASALFSVRNTGTKRELIERGCDAAKIEVVPDSGMFLRAKRIRVPGFKSGRIKVGFNWTTDREDQTFPPPHQETREAFLTKCIAVLNHAIEKHRAQIVYIGHMHKNFDAAVIQALKTRLAAPPIVIDEVFERFYPASVLYSQYLADIYRQLDVVMGMRGHANIVAFGQNTPHIGLGTHRKIRYFLEDTHRSRYWFDARPGSATPVEQMKGLLDELIENRGAHRRSMQVEYRRQYRLFMAFNRRVIDLLRDARP